jgi:hypothetical protein
MSFLGAAIAAASSGALIAYLRTLTPAKIQ